MITGLVGMATSRRMRVAKEATKVFKEVMLTIIVGFEVS